MWDPLWHGEWQSHHWTLGRLYLQPAHIYWYRLRQPKPCVIWPYPHNREPKAAIGSSEDIFLASFLLQCPPPHHGQLHPRGPLCQEQSKEQLYSSFEGQALGLSPPQGETLCLAKVPASPGTAFTCSLSLWNLPCCMVWMSSTREVQNRKVNCFSDGFIWHPWPVQNQRHLQNCIFAAPFFSVLPSVAPLLARRAEHLGKQPAWSFICGSSSYTEREGLLTFSKEHFRTSYRLCLLLLRIRWPFKEKEFRMQLGYKNYSASLHHYCLLTMGCLFLDKQ